MFDLNKIKEKAYLIAAMAAVVVILIPIGYSIVTNLFAGPPQPRPFLEMPDEKYKECVRETEFMRHHHWELLRNIREEVVRYGKRTDININRCRECHVSRETFCNRCHNSVNLYPDCFGCHYYPEPSEMAENRRDSRDRAILYGQSIESPPDLSGE
jgi:hypothetical protein